MANEIARALRKRMTPQEVKVWAHLRALRHSHGYRFRRQVPLRGFIVDFACFQPKVVIELDGSQHAETSNAVADRARDALLERFGFSVLRFWNVEVDNEFGGVWDVINEALLNAKLRDDGDKGILALDGRGVREADGVGGSAPLSSHPHSHRAARADSSPPPKSPSRFRTTEVPAAQRPVGRA